MFLVLFASQILNTDKVTLVIDRILKVLAPRGVLVVRLTCKDFGVWSTIMDKQWRGVEYVSNLFVTTNNSVRSCGRKGGGGEDVY